MSRQDDHFFNSVSLDSFATAAVAAAGVPFIGGPTDLVEKYQSMRSGRFAGFALGKIVILL